MFLLKKIFLLLAASTSSFTPFFDVERGFFFVFHAIRTPSSSSRLVSRKKVNFSVVFFSSSISNMFLDIFCNAMKCKEEKTFVYNSHSFCVSSCGIFQLMEKRCWFEGAGAQGEDGNSSVFTENVLMRLYDFHQRMWIFFDSGFKRACGFYFLFELKLMRLEGRWRGGLIVWFLSSKVAGGVERKATLEFSKSFYILT